MSGGYRKSAKVALGQVFDYAQNVADTHTSGTTRSIGGVAASIAGKGLQNISSKTGPKTETEDFLDSYENSKRKSHFMDDFLNILLTKGMHGDDPESKLIEARMKDPDRANRPSLSPRLIYSNFRKLAGRMSALFAVQYGILHVITWRKPAKTLTVLVLYTWLCLWPHLILAYPLIFFLFGVMIPGYLYRHPQRIPEFIKVKKRGQSLFDFFNQLNERSIIDEYINSEVQETMKKESQGFELDSKSSSSSSSRSGSVVEMEAELNPDAISDKGKKKKPHFKSEVTLLMNMTDLQNLTTDLVQGYDTAELMWYETGGFKDEGYSTLIVYLVTIATSIVLFFGPYIPWRLIFIQTGWAALLLCHPHSKKHIQRIQKKPSTKRKTDFVKQQVEKVERQDIIVDGGAESRLIEIYELQRKSPLAVNWSFYMYANYMFDQKNHLRASGKRPTGVDHLSKIQPPKTWKFDIGYVNEWVIDTNPKDFIYARSLNIDDYIFTNSEGWIYDNNQSELDSQYQFRRRRLYRKCYRYSRPSPLPPRLRDK